MRNALWFGMGLLLMAALGNGPWPVQQAHAKVNALPTTEHLVVPLNFMGKGPLVTSMNEDKAAPKVEDEIQERV